MSLGGDFTRARAVAARARIGIELRRIDAELRSVVLDTYSELRRIDAELNCVVLDLSQGKNGFS
jgi:hypothetical protein